MSASALRLRQLSPEDEEAALAAHDALAASDDFPFLLEYRPGEPWARYLSRLDDQRTGKALFNGWVPATYLVAVVDGRLVGATSVRHRLNDRLLVSGGHIGYCVVPSERRKGYATEILRQGLVVAASLGIGAALVTCADSNAGSRRVIEACGGVLDSVFVHPRDGNLRRRYWVECLPPGEVGSWQSRAPLV